MNCRICSASTMDTTLGLQRHTPAHTRNTLFGINIAVLRASLAIN